MEDCALIVGAGPMAKEYAKVLHALERPFLVAARDPERTRAFAEAQGARGWFQADKLDEETFAELAYAIVCTPIDTLEPLAERLLRDGVRALLLEKPGTLDPEASRRLDDLARQRGASVRIACNRRLFASVRKLRRILQDEEPVLASFDFSERTTALGTARWPAAVLGRWAVANSIHVIDTVFHLLGAPRDLQARVSDKDTISWHPSGATFVGTGRCGETNVAWATSWLCPGRWSIEVLTRAGRYRLCPMETLQVLRHAGLDWQEVPLGDEEERRYKPGLFALVHEFERVLEGKDSTVLPDCAENARTLETIWRIAGYAS